MVRWVELFSCARISAIGGAARCDKEGAAGDGAPDGAAMVDGHWDEPFHNVASASLAAIGCEYRYSVAVWLGLKRVRHLGGDGRQSQLCGARVSAAQDCAGHGLLFALEHPHPLADLVGWPVLLQDAGHPIIQAAVFLAADGLGAGALVVVNHVPPQTRPPINLGLERLHRKNEGCLEWR